MNRFIYSLWVLAALTIALVILPADSKAQAWQLYNSKSWDYGVTVEWYVDDDIDTDLVSSTKLKSSGAANHWDDGNISGSSLDFDEGSSYSSIDLLNK
jgi:hypothetical protein